MKLISWRPWAAMAVLGAAAWPAAAVSVGQPAPEIEGRVVTDAPALRHLRGRVVLLDFWASWCGPCKESFPWMNALHDRFGAQGLQIIAVNVDRRREDAARFLARTPARFSIAYDPQGQAAAAYAVPAMPSSVLIGADGRVLQVHAGFKPEDTAALEAAIESALDAAKAGARPRTQP
jgi:thiol-disulfide isomerase/thioredoxin